MISPSVCSKSASTPSPPSSSSRLPDYFSVLFVLCKWQPSVVPSALPVTSSPDNANWSHRPPSYRSLVTLITYLPPASHNNSPFLLYSHFPPSFLLPTPSRLVHVCPFTFRRLSMASAHPPTPLPPLQCRAACHFCQAISLQSDWRWCVFSLIWLLPRTDFSLSLTLSSFSLSCPAEAMEQCQVFSSNAVITCFPTADTSVPQHDWASVVCAYPFSPLAFQFTHISL